MDQEPEAGGEIDEIMDQDEEDAPDSEEVQPEET